MYREKPHIQKFRDAWVCFYKSDLVPLGDGGHATVRGGLGGTMLQAYNDHILVCAGASQKTLDLKGLKQWVVKKLHSSRRLFLQVTRYNNDTTVSGVKK